MAKNVQMAKATFANAQTGVGRVATQQANERRRRGRFFFLRNNGCCSRVGESSKTTRGIRYCNYGKSRFHHWPVCGFLFAYTCH